MSTMDSRAAPTRCRRPRGPTATLMCADARFDLCTSSAGYPLAVAAVEAAAEIMVAAACLVVGVRAGVQVAPLIALATSLRSLPSW